MFRYSIFIALLIAVFATAGAHADWADDDYTDDDDDASDDDSAASGDDDAVDDDNDDDNDDNDDDDDDDRKPGGCEHLVSPRSPTVAIPVMFTGVAVLILLTVRRKTS